MKVPAPHYGPPTPVLIVAGLAAIILLVLIAKTVVDLLYAIVQLGIILAALAAIAWIGNYLLRRMKP